MASLVWRAAATSASNQSIVGGQQNVGTADRAGRGGAPTDEEYQFGPLGLAQLDPELRRTHAASQRQCPVRPHSSGHHRGAPATVRRYVASVATLHRAADLPDPTKHAAVRFALKRLARAEDGSGTALVARSKTDQEARGSVGYLAARTMTALGAWCAAARLTGGPIVRGVHKTGRLGRPLDPGDVARVFKKLARRAGLDSAAVSGHSCRVGMAQDLVAFGADLPAVTQAGRWQTPAMPARYAERLLAARNVVAQFHARSGAR